MVSPRTLLTDDEQVVLSTRTHGKALLGPVVVLLVVAALGGFLTSLTTGSHAGTWRLVLAAAVALVLLRFVVVPFLTWRGTSYTFTDRRLITRSGILTRRGHDVALDRISDISYEQGVVDRVLGCGTLVVSDAGGADRIELHDIPGVEGAHLAVSQRLLDGAQRTDDGT